MGTAVRATEQVPPIDRDARPSGLSGIEQERRSCVTAILAAAEILRDYYCELASRERDCFVQAIIDESARLQRTFEAAS